MGVSEWGARALDVQVPAGKRGKEGGEREIERESHCNPKLGNRRATKCCNLLVSSTFFFLYASSTCCGAETAADALEAREGPSAAS